MKLRRPSPALVVSVVALVVACAGTAGAAVVISNSSQIKTGAVSGSDIHDGSITGADLSKGLAGLIAKASQAGGGLGIEAVRKSGPDGQPAGVEVNVASLKAVPAGTYLILAKTMMTAFVGQHNLITSLLNNDSSAGGHCTIDTHGDVDESRQQIVTNGLQTPATFNMQLTRTTSAPTDFDLICDAQSPFRTSDTSIIAIKLSGTSRTDITG